jgi:hypothetical protein
VEGAVFADGVAEEEVEDAAGVGPGLAQAEGESGGAGLFVGTDGGVELVVEVGCLDGADGFEVFGSRMGGPVEEVASSVDAVEGDLVGAEDEAGALVAGVGDGGHVSPGVGGVAGVDADGGSVDASEGFSGLDFTGGSAGVSEDELVGGEGDGFSDGGGEDAFGEGGGGGVGGLVGGGGEEGLGEGIDPVVVGGPVSGGEVVEFVLVEEFGEEGARTVDGVGVTVFALALDAVVDGLAEEGMGLFGADEAEEVPGAVGEDGAVDLGVVLDGVEEFVEGVVGAFEGEGGEGGFGSGDVSVADGVAEGVSAGAVGGELAEGIDGVEDFVGGASEFLDPVGVAVEDLEHGQRAAVHG